MYIDEIEMDKIGRGIKEGKKWIEFKQVRV